MRQKTHMLKAKAQQVREQAKGFDDQRLETGKEGKRFVQRYRTKEQKGDSLITIEWFLAIL